MRTFGHDIPRLSWIGAKTFPQHGISRKNQSGHGPEHAEANKEHRQRTADAVAAIETIPVQLLLADGE
jgi:hypothetical protein